MNTGREREENNRIIRSVNNRLLFRLLGANKMKKKKNAFKNRTSSLYEYMMPIALNLSL